MLSYGSSILLALGASASFFGKVSYFALFFQFIVNIFILMPSKKNILRIVFYLTYFLFLLLLFFIFDSDKDLNVSILNIYLQILVFITLSYSRYMFNIVRRSLLIQLIVSFLVCAYGIIVNDHSMFINAANTKGMGDFLIPKGVFSTPQALASVAVATLLFYQYRVVKGIAFTTLLVSLNRTMLIVYLSAILTKYYKLIFCSLIFILLLAFFYISAFDNVINLRTVTSRIYLFEGALSEINTDSLRQWLFGTLTKVQFHLSIYNVDKDYIESSYLFIFKNFGLLGCIVYTFFGIKTSLLMFKRKELTIFAFFFMYFFFAQLMTHEFLISSFYQIVFLAMAFKYKDDVGYASK